MFIGRQKELERLRQLKFKKSASLVVISGRRRIGKSRLSEEFGKEYKFYSFSGFPPSDGDNAQSQRENFALQIQKKFHVPIKSDNWYQMLSFLAKETLEENAVILLDEISWMGSKDPVFLGTLKTVWDQEFKKNPNLVLIICGSISYWIEQNILSSTGFLGRISLNMHLKELSLSECSQFWDKRHASSYEILKVLSVTSGVPRYLEELNTKESAEENIKKLCFRESGILVSEFDQIFSDLFESRNKIYKEIVLTLIDGKKERDEIAKAVSLPANGVFSGYLTDLEKAGFIARDFTWDFKNTKALKLSKYRICDNYIRFYLKYIMPNREKIKKDGYTDFNLMNLPNYTTVMGLQFENLVINNFRLLIKALNIPPEIISNDGPYFQKKTLKNKGCQIDYLIQTNLNELYIVEIKFSRSEIGKSIISQMQEKIDALSKPKHFAIRSVLVHVNGASEEVLESGFFYKVIDFGEFL